jgi:predicted ArsR family transcriptional regulator
MNGWNQRLLATTRGRIVVLLRRARRTVDDLAGALNLTDNAVRSHLATLERDGLIRQHGEKRGDGKPARLYELTSAADGLFPKAYDSILRDVLDVLGERLPPDVVRGLLREVGRRVAADFPRSVTGDARQRADRAASVLFELGGLAEVESTDDALRIRGYSCPLAAILAGHPEACELAASLIAESTGLRVTEHCEKDDPPRCCFELEA